MWVSPYWVYDFPKHQATHNVVFVKAGPLKGGFPVRRKRMFSFGGTRGWLVWVGPTTDAGVQEAWDVFYSRAVVASGSIFMQASSQEIVDFTRRVAANRRHAPPVGSVISFVHKGHLSLTMLGE